MTSASTAATVPDRVQWTLSEIMATPGVRHATVATSDGLLVTKSNNTPQELAEKTAACVAGLHTMGSALSEEYAPGKPLDHVVVQSEGTHLFIRAAGTRSYLVVDGDPEADAGPIAGEMVRTARKVGAIIDPPERAPRDE